MAGRDHDGRTSTCLKRCIGHERSGCRLREVSDLEAGGEQHPDGVLHEGLRRDPGVAPDQHEATVVGHGLVEIGCETGRRANHDRSVHAIRAALDDAPDPRRPEFEGASHAIGELLCAAVRQQRGQLGPCPGVWITVDPFAGTRLEVVHTGEGTSVDTRRESSRTNRRLGDPMTWAEV